ncbi:ankyrin repeat-containing domain protein [Syncephalastrum racemosum]|uniref:Ankyrin repeat-containing domain protein n=1 Tax=Syncephalastrum racemosum TaxID=13706 RepID=A0A1X2HCZ7_SYNRA|nr:ankyrin repeat-containing domain protein [Syncephalastrum racemosum]
MESEEIEGASPNEIMLAACRNDQDDLLEDLLKTGKVDLTFTDAIGNTALHYAAKYGALSCLELLADEPGINPNAVDTVEHNAPLHEVTKYRDDSEIALAMAEILLQMEADPRLKNREGLMPIDLVDPRDEDLSELLECALAADTMDDDDFAQEDMNEEEVEYEESEY